MRESTAPSTVVRAARDPDLLAVAAIYDDAVANTVASFDLEAQGVGHWQTRLHSGDPLLVATEGDEVVGYAHAGPFRPRPGYAATTETSVYVRTDARGRGVGRHLYEVLLAGLDRAGAHRVVAVVALPNDASVALHEAYGFRRVGVLTEVGRKFDRWVDVAVYERGALAAQDR